MIALYIIAAIVIADFTGMFYWMYKSRKGTLNLSTSSWHFKLMHYMWDADTTSLTNACPYYHGLVLSLLGLPLYLIIRYILVPIVKKINNLKLLNKIVEKMPDKPVINFPQIPQTKKETFNVVYRKGKNILNIIFWIAISCVFLYLFGNILYLFVKEVGIWWLLGLILSIFYIVGIKILHIKNEEYDKYSYEHWENLIKGIIGVLSIIPRIIWAIISYLFCKFTGAISDVCPAIEWEKQ